MDKYFIQCDKYSKPCEIMDQSNGTSGNKQ